MKVRLLTALGIAVFGIPLLIFSEYVIYSIALGLLSGLAAWELLRVLGMHKKYAVSVPSIMLSALMPLFAYDYFIPAQKQTVYILIMALAIFAYLLYLAFVSVFSRGTLGYKNVASVFMAVTYVSVSFTSLALVRYMTNGVYLFEMIFIGAWVCDSFAYFTGRLFGKHKLAPELSPKKTVEGAVGGIVFTVLAFMLYGLIIESFFGLSVNYLILAVTGLILSVVGQVGDLWASLIKREYGVKDYSRILPGHGGIMDRFDSILVVSTTLLIICLLFPPFA